MDFTRNRRSNSTINRTTNSPLKRLHEFYTNDKVTNCVASSQHLIFIQMRSLCDIDFRFSEDAAVTIPLLFAIKVLVIAGSRKCNHDDNGAIKGGYLVYSNVDGSVWQKKIYLNAYYFCRN